MADLLLNVEVLTDGTVTITSGGLPVGTAVEPAARAVADVVRRAALEATGATPVPADASVTLTCDTCGWWTGPSALAEGMAVAGEHARQNPGHLVRRPDAPRGPIRG